ncbi:MAG TPA: hypothetical protein DCP71_02835 [Verrucomicrobiales bacterium]|nr:hypothetical protein [Verrucomicrobiales bacterium]
MSYLDPTSSRLLPPPATASFPRPDGSGQRHDLAALKQQLRIPQMWLQLGLPGVPGASVKSPFRPDRHPSFSIFAEDLCWKDHATGEGGDVIDFLARACQVDKAEATRQFLQFFGLSPQPPAGATRHQKAARPSLLLPTQRPAPRPASALAEVTERRLVLPMLHQGSEEEIRTVAERRRLSFEAVSLAQSLGCLAFGNVCSHASWLLGDAAGLVAEARRLDGLPYPPLGPLGERKAHTLRGSSKAWPCGVAVLRAHPHFRTLMLVEGGPDYLAALHFALLQGRHDVLPMALLGRGTGSRLSPEALHLIGQRRVRIYPHEDADGGGLAAAWVWRRQLRAAGCKTDAFHFTGLLQADGRPVKDLNDAALCDNHQQSELNKLIP